MNGIWVKSEDFAIPFAQVVVGCVRGYRVFTAMKTVRRQLFHAKAHLERLINSAKKLQMDVGFSADFILDGLNQVVRRNEQESGEFLIEVFLSGGPADFSGVAPLGATRLDIWVMPLNEVGDEVVQRGVMLATFAHQRPFAPVKLTFYVGGVVAHQTVVKQWGADYPLFVSDANDPLVLEGSTFSVMAVIDGGIVGPPVGTTVLDGITRRIVEALAQQNGIEVQHRNLTLSEIKMAEEVFLTSSTRNVLGVVKLDGTLIGNGKPGILTQRLRALFSAYEQQYSPEFELKFSLT